MSKIDRRYFMRSTAALSSMTLIAPSFALLGNDDVSQIEKWQRMMKDPVYDMLKENPDLDQILGLFPRPKGPAAFDSRVIQANIQKLKENTLSSILKTWPADPCDWWLPARLEDIPRPRYATETLEASYTNYRYWLELLSSGILPEEMANRIVNARLNGGGQFCGMTRFINWLDDWPLTEYLYGLWRLGRKNDFLISLYGHVAYSQCEGHLTAYEQFNFPGDPEGSKKADYVYDIPNGV